MFTLHVLSCGHGDTLLLHMPRNKWALIDCHLRGRVALERFYSYTDKLAITSLDYVVLTHADFDHYSGMADVLERFSENGRSVRFFCDSGANHKHVRLLQEASGLPEPDMKEYARLLTTVDTLTQSTSLQRQWLHDGTATIRVKDDQSGFSIVVVSPSPTVAATAADKELLGNSSGQPNINELSIVLIAQQVTLDSACRMFLPGDVEGDGLTGALSRWDTHHDNEPSAKQFDVIKVPHHGSKNGHDTALVDRIATKGSSAAAISSGKRVGCPSRSVLADYLKAGWRVHCTTPRVAESNTSSALQRTVAGKTRLTAGQINTFNLTIAVEAGKAVDISPTGSKVVQADLLAYE